MANIGFLHTGDPNAQAGTFAEALPDDTYVVSGINRFISVDDKDEPIFSSKYGDTLKVVFEFKVVGQDRGLACSRTAAEFYALALAFGVDLKGVTAKNRMSSKTIQDTGDALNNSGKTLTVQSRGGWVNFIRSADLPEGQYALKMKDIRRRDFAPGLEFVPGEYGPNLVFELEVVGDGGGRHTLWDGFVFNVFMNDPWIDSMVEGETVKTSHELGCPIFEKDTNSGGDTLLVKRWVEFCKGFAPEVLDHAWQSDPVQSKFGIDEIASPQYVVAGYALGTPRTNVMLYKMRKNKRGLDFLELPLFNQSQEEEDQPEVLNTLVDFIEKTWGKDLFDNTPNSSSAIVFTDKGREWAVNVLQTAWDAVGLGDKKPLHKLSEEEATKLLKTLRESYGRLEDAPEVW